ncbi:MAG: DUF6090 family protein [Rhodothermales bacterium]
MDRKITWLKVDWRYALRELVLIVAGILIAIALNSWWNSKVDYEQETQYLSGIETDIENSIAELNATINFHEQQVKDLRKLFGIVHAEPSQARKDSLLELSHALIFNSTFEPELATYDEMLASGNLNLLESERIRNALTLYQYQLQNNNDFNNYLEQQSSLTIEPFFMENLAYHPLKGLDEPYRPPDIDLTALYTDLHFHNLILLRLDTEANVLEIRKRLLETMHDVQRYIKEELVQRGVSDGE